MAKKRKNLTERDVLNVGKIEQTALANLRKYLDYAIDSIGTELQKIADRTEENIRDAYSKEEAYAEAISHIDVSDVLGNLSSGFGHLSSGLAKIEAVTEETELVKAAEAMEKAVDKAPLWKEGEEMQLRAGRKALVDASNAVPEALTGPGALRMLQGCFKSVAKALDILVNYRFTVPNVPNALAEDDPRQLGLEFTAASSLAPKFEPAFKQQLSLMRKNPPHVTESEGHIVIEVFSPFVKKYIPVAEYSSMDLAQKDLGVWVRAHKETLRNLTVAVEEEAETKTASSFWKADCAV